MHLIIKFRVNKIQNMNFFDYLIQVVEGQNVDLPDFIIQQHSLKYRIEYVYVMMEIYNIIFTKDAL